MFAPDNVQPAQWKMGRTGLAPDGRGALVRRHDVAGPVLALPDRGALAVALPAVPARRDLARLQGRCCHAGSASGSLSPGPR